jgi:hypothetical protein
MKLLKGTAIGIGIFVLLLIIISAIFYFILFPSSRIAFISNNKAYSWDINSQVLQQNVEPQLFANDNPFRRIVVVISGKYKSTALYRTLSNYDPPLFNAEWSVYGPIDILHIYLNSPEWDNADSLQRNSLLSTYILGILMPARTHPSSFDVGNVMSILDSGSSILSISKH